MKCYYCAAEIPDDSERCPRCRQAVKKVKSDREIAREASLAAKAEQKAGEAAGKGQGNAPTAQATPVPVPPPPPPAPVAPPADKPVPQRFQYEHPRFKRGTMIGDLIAWWQMPHFRIGLAAIVGSAVLIAVLVVALSHFA